MNISVKGQYALRAIFDLALQPHGQPVRIGDIARRQAIPQKFLELILAGLKQGGFVESRRGAEGGYRLSRPADQISVGEVLRFMEDSKRSRRPAPDPFTHLWKMLDASIASVVDRTTFADLVRDWKESQTNYVPNWQI